MATKKIVDSTKSSVKTKAKAAKVKTAKTTPAKKSVRVKKPATAAKRVRAKKAVATTAPAPTPVTPEERSQLIAVAAYLRAESRGFAYGNEVEDWLCAEREVDARLAEAS
jgi:hypothetical protein